MSLLDQHQLAKLAERMNLFQPSGINDDKRVDLTSGAPFLAIDTSSPHERDDAIRSRRLRGAGGFLIQTAIADGAQIPHLSEYVDGAMLSKASTYRGKRIVDTMLSEVVVRQLELSPDKGKQRALVIETLFDNDGFQKSSADVYPAWVNIEAINFGGFAVKHLLGGEGLNHPIAKFHETFRANRPDLTGGAPVALDGTKSNAMYGSDVNQDFMIIGNLSATEVARQRGIPLLHRRFPTVESIWSQNGQTVIDRQHYLLDGGDPAGEYVPYARVSSPMREAVSLANHILFGAHMADYNDRLIQNMAIDLHEQFTA